MVLRFFLLASVFFFASCVSVDRSNPDDPNGDNYQSERKSSSSNSASVKNYCVYAELKQCYFGIYSACPGVGGVLADDCPYSSSSSNTAYSSGQSQSGKSSSAVKEYDYCVFISEKMCLTGPLTNCPPGGTLSNSCPYESSSSSSAQSSSSTKPSSSSNSVQSSSSSSRSSSSNSLPSSSSVAQSSSSSNSVPSSSSLVQSSSSNAAVSSSSVATPSSSSVAQSSSTVPSSSSSTPPSSSSIAITYTLTCANINTFVAEGTAITAPAVSCAGPAGATVVTSGLSWTNAPNWSSPEGGVYTGISVAASSGNCSGKTATCNGTVMVQAGVIMSDPVEYGGENYETVKIGAQTWFKRNLNYDVEGSRCYSDITANCEKYGKLYDWATAMVLPASCNSTVSCASQVKTKHQGICPDGWHIPSDAEWTTLINFVGKDPAKKLKANSNLWSPNTGTDYYGFSALPGGYSRAIDRFESSGGLGNWWSTTESIAGRAYSRYMNGGSEGGKDGSNDKTYLLSVRCVKD